MTMHVNEWTQKRTVMLCMHWIISFLFLLLPLPYSPKCLNAPPEEKLFMCLSTSIVHNASLIRIFFFVLCSYAILRFKSLGQWNLLKPHISLKIFMPWRKQKSQPLLYFLSTEKSYIRLLKIYMCIHTQRKKKAIVTYCNSCCIEKQDITEKQSSERPHILILAIQVGT